MTTRRAVIATVCVAVAVVVLGLAAVFALVDPRSRNANQRAAAIGRGAAAAGLVPIAVIWGLWAVKVRKDRAAREDD